MDSSVRPVLKALGDETRFQIYTWLRQWSAPVTINEVAEAFDLHPNTVRPHLESLRDAGLVRLDTSPQGSVGRPQHRFTAVEADIELHRHPEDDDAFELLARLLAETCCRQSSSPTAAVEIGRETGHSLVARRSRRRSVGSGTGSRDGGRGTAGLRPVDVLEQELGRIGFDVAAEGDRVAFTGCPFRTLAEVYPDLVCAIHEGVTCGVVEASGGRLEEFHGLDDLAPCTAVVGSTS